MRWVALPVGIVILLWTLLDVFRTLVMPRAARGRIRLSRILFRLLWRPWRWVGVRRKTIQARERVLAGAAPFFFLLVLVGWVSLALLGYALILWSPAFVDGIGRGGDSFVDALYVAGSALFTLGARGDVTGSTRAVVVAAGATGLGLFAVVIAYLPVLYQAFNRREVGVLLLDARAGSPPSGPELLHRMGSAGVASSLPDLFEEWERWVADVLEDLFFYLRLTEREAVIQRDEFEDVLDDMREDGFVVRPVDEAYERFTEKRAKYAPRLDAIAVLLAAPPGLWIGDRSFLGARTSH
jgi:hypothetical protein